VFEVVKGGQHEKTTKIVSSYQIHSAIINFRYNKVGFYG